MNDNLISLENSNTISFLDDKSLTAHNIKISRMVNLAMALIPEGWVNRQEVEGVLGEAYRSVDLAYGVEEANLWADGFKFPNAVVWEDAIELQNHGWSLSSLAAKKNSVLIGERFSVERLMALWDHDDPDFHFLLELAEGVPVWRDVDFVPTLTPPTLSQAYSNVSGVINKLCYEQWERGQAIILPYPVLTDDRCISRAQISFSGKYGWVPKHGSREGRPTNNYSYDNKDHGLINSDYVKRAVKEFYGAIELAQLESLMQMILDQVKIANGNWEDVVLWKMDLKGAFALLNFKVDEIGLLTMILTENLCFLSLVGNFGLSQFPFIFGVISRVLLRAINSEIQGEMKIFVDDFLGASQRQYVESDMKIAREVAERLLGKYAVSEKKTFVGPILDWIGWEVNLVTKTVTIANHNLYKTLYGFFKLEKGQRVTVKEIQRLASWASRYTLICRYMRPFTYYLYNAIKGRKQLQALIDIDGSLWMVIQLWQIFLVMAKLRPENYAKPIMSFSIHRHVSLWISYDASLTGFGFTIWNDDPSGKEKNPSYHTVLSVVSFDTPYELNRDSGYQNTMEFLAILMAMYRVKRLGFTNTLIHVIGDNTSSLHWCDKERFRGGRSNGPALAYIILGMNSQNEIVSSSYIKGEDNIHCDKMSRGIRPRSLGYPKAVCWNAHRDRDFIELIRLVDPRVENMEEEMLKNLWGNLRNLFEN